jgi:hypothetical protein
VFTFLFLNFLQAGECNRHTWVTESNLEGEKKRGKKKKGKERERTK